ncbi:30S ribosomal protein S8 [Patescibacteria group bacterium]|nr:30S ribosomal protein S8 [Patescibacteria group bacterium]MCL5010557.1 30S ribosomal protein S8 [Patescibacteria group bacterium]
MNYTIADFIIAIKNAGLSRRREMFFPYTGVIKEISDVLVKNKLIESSKTEKKGQVLHIVLFYRNKKSVISDVRIVSKPSLRVYEGYLELVKRQKIRASKVIVSTSKGIKTSEEAVGEKLGGEVLFEIS